MVACSPMVDADCASRTEEPAVWKGVHRSARGLKSPSTPAPRSWMCRLTSEVEASWQCSLAEMATGAGASKDDTHRCCKQMRHFRSSDPGEHRTARGLQGSQRPQAAALRLDFRTLGSEELD